MTITISSTTVNASTNFSGATCKLRIYSSHTFTASDGTPVMAGTPGSGNFFKEVSCTIAAGVISIPSFTIPSTTDGVDLFTARYTAIFFDARNVKRDEYFVSFQVPTTLGATTTWAALRIHKAGRQPIRDLTTYTKQQVDALIALAVSGSGAPKMTDVIYGIGKLSVAAISAAVPIVVGDNDPRIINLNSSGNLIAVNELIIGADSDSSGTHALKLQTRGTTRLEITNAGNVNIANFLGINTPVPTQNLQFTMRYAPNTTSSEVVLQSVSPTGTVAGVVHTPFEIYHRTTMFGSDRTDTVGIGFTGVGGSNGIGNWGIGFEDSFVTFPNDQFEFHLWGTPSDGSGQKRPWTWVIRRDTGAATVTTSAQTMNFKTGFLADADAVRNVFEFTAAGANFALNQTGGAAVFGVATDQVIFSTLANNGTPAKQLMIRPSPADSQQSWLVWNSDGGTSGESILPIASGFRLYTGGSNLNPAVLGVNRVLVYGSTWGANPTAALNDGGVLLAAGKVVYFGSTSDPFGASDAYLIRSGVAIIAAVNPISGLEATFLGKHDTVNDYKVSGTKVVGARGAAVADAASANATDLATALTLVNELKAQVNTAFARLRSTTGHGLWT